MGKNLNGTGRIAEYNSLTSYLDQIGRFPILPHDEQTRLALLVQKGDAEAREQLIISHLRFVVSVAKEYARWGLDFLDLIQEGNIGLMKAVGRFQPELGNCLTTYAKWWIRQRILRALVNQTRDIRLPIHVVERCRKIFRVTEELAQKFGRAPSDEEISQATGISVDFIAQRESFASSVSLHTPLSEEGGETIGDIIPDEKVTPPSEGADSSTIATCLNAALKTLNKREQFVLKCRFGERLTLTETGKRLGVTREIVRQVEGLALRKLRSKSRLRLIKGALSASE